MADDGVERNTTVDISVVGHVVGGFEVERQQRCLVLWNCYVWESVPSSISGCFISSTAIHGAVVIFISLIG